MVVSGSIKQSWILFWRSLEKRFSNTAAAVRACVAIGRLKLQLVFIAASGPRHAYRCGYGAAGNAPSLLMRISTSLLSRAAPPGKPGIRSFTQDGCFLAIVYLDSC